MIAYRKTLLAAGVAGIVAVAAAPHALEAWRASRVSAQEAERQLYIQLKEREIACLERLAASGLPKEMDVNAEIERCRRLSIDPATGETVRAPPY